MTRDETVALFLECEAKRGEARAAALAAGKHTEVAEALAHEAAKAHWNAWADALLAERKALEDAGTWKSRRDFPRGVRKGENPGTLAWLKKAIADFSSCHFHARGVDGIEETPGQAKKAKLETAHPVKSIELEADKSIRFDSFVFPGPADFERATLRPTDFECATIGGVFSAANFRGAIFLDVALFPFATFCGGDIDFLGTTFRGSASFFGATFRGCADFQSATFRRTAGFQGATFHGAADFQSATFRGDAYLHGATFRGNADFQSATFRGDALFDGATFRDSTSFALASFKQNASFASSCFEAEASFDAIRSESGFDMAGAVFEAVPDFIQAHFEEAPQLDNLKVYGRWIPRHPRPDRKVSKAQPEKDELEKDRQEEPISRWRQRWHAALHFGGRVRGWTVRAAKATWRQVWPERKAPKEQPEERERPKEPESRWRQRGHALWHFGRWILTWPVLVVLGAWQRCWHAVRQFGGWVRSWSMRVSKGAWREMWPERKAPKEQPVEIRREKVNSKWRQHWHAVRYFGGRVRTWPVRAALGAWRRVWVGNASIPARWRALKRLAIQGHDTERELEFHARELQSQRFETDWPLPFRFWSAQSWAGFLRFLFGLLYGLFSDFGRSILRPLLLWLATIAVFALYFLSGQSYVAHPVQPLSYTGSAQFYARLVPALWRAPPPCYRGTFDEDGKPRPELTGLVEPVAASTNALNEAILLAVRNGSVVLDAGEDAARRTYGCLYGIQTYGRTSVPFVPGFVTLASGIQKLLSALYIFLLGLALRNMLKMK